VLVGKSWIGNDNIGFVELRVTDEDIFHMGYKPDPLRTVSSFEEWLVGMIKRTQISPPDGCVWASAFVSTAEVRYTRVEEAQWFDVTLANPVRRLTPLEAAAVESPSTKTPLPWTCELYFQDRDPDHEYKWGWKVFAHSEHLEDCLETLFEFRMGQYGADYTQGRVTYDKAALDA
jgi:hypothetical protein